MRRGKIYVIIAVAIVTFALLLSCKKTPAGPDEQELNEWYSGGRQTVFTSGSGAFTQIFSGLSAKKEALHEFGDAAFGATFNSDNSQLNHGLGPIFNNQSCISCHIADGRGKAPETGEKLSSLLLRISQAGYGEHGEPNAVPLFGGQLQQRAILGILPEANVNVSYSEISYSFSDGEVYKLRVPKFVITNQYQNFPANTMISARIASPVFGLGLLEGIEESAIVSKADEYDVNGDGISGKPNYVYDILSKTKKLGRFGWKAGQPDIMQQSAGAYSEDMGITNFIFPKESSFGQMQYDNKNDDVELGDSTLYAVAYYIKTLAVPGRRDADNPDVKTGKKIFTDIGCGNCHTPKQQTKADMIFSELSNQIIYPYTDLLLHDMGEGLADKRPEYEANGFEWRTPPLWGIGLTTIVNGHTNFLHDGRARNITEAIMWHGGEAKNATEKFAKLTKLERLAVLRFINSL